MNSPKADALFFLGMVQRGKLTPERALADLGTPKKLELLLAGYAAKDPKLGAEIIKMAEHRRRAVEELKTLLVAEETGEK